MNLFRKLISFFKPTPDEPTITYGIIPFLKLYSVPYVQQFNRIMIFLDPSVYTDSKIGPYAEKTLLETIELHVNKRSINHDFDTNGIVNFINITRDKETWHRMQIANTFVSIYNGFDLFKIYQDLIRFSKDIPYSSMFYADDKKISETLSPILNHLNIRHIAFNNFVFMRECDIDSVYYLLSSIPMDIPSNSFVQDLLESCHSVYDHGYYNKRRLAILCGVDSDAWDKTCIAVQTIAENYNVSHHAVGRYGDEFTELRGVAVLVYLLQFKDFTECNVDDLMKVMGTNDLKQRGNLA